MGAHELGFGVVDALLGWRAHHIRVPAGGFFWGGGRKDRAGAESGKGRGGEGLISLMSHDLITKTIKMAPRPQCLSSGSWCKGLRQFKG